MTMIMFLPTLALFSPFIFVLFFTKQKKRKSFQCWEKGGEEEVEINVREYSNRVERL